MGTSLADAFTGRSACQYRSAQLSYRWSVRSNDINISFIGTVDDALIRFIFHARTALTARQDTDIPTLNKSLQLKPFQFSTSTNLFNTSIPCPNNTTGSISPSASVSLDAGANVNASVTLFAVGGGTVFPIISDFELQFGAYSNLNMLGRIAKRLTR